MSSRDAILSKIRTALADDPPREAPPVPEIWPRTDPPVDAMIDRFAEELDAVTGELHRCDSIEAARKKLAELLDELEPGKLGVTDHPACGELTADLDSDRIDAGNPDPKPPEMAQLAAGLVGADVLLADTGTLMVACATPRDRLMCYLPPVCFIVARTDQLVEHMPAAWDQIAARVADPDLRGEFVFITGPSRTADIEKILILGVHGPKRLIVLLVG